MAVTAGGTPYVESTDLVANYPATSLSLANKVDTKADLATPRLTGTPSIADGGNTAGAGGSLEFRIASFPTALGMSTIKGYNENFATTEFQGGVSLFTRPVGGAPQSLTERMRIDNVGIITGTGSLGAFLSYTPVLGGGWVLGNGTVTGKYQRIGKIVSFYVVIVFGSTSTFGAGGSQNLTVTLPLTISSGFNQPELVFNAGATDTSLGSVYRLNAFIASTTTVILSSAVSPIIGITNTSPFSWANTDRIAISGIYEGA